MKNTIIKYGLYATAVLIGFNIISLVIFGTDASYFDIGEIFGYSAIILCLVFVFIGIRHYEISVPNTTFLSRMGIGTGISLFPALFFGLYNILYVEVIDPEFTDKYMKHQLTKMEASMSPADFEVAKTQLMQEFDMYHNTFFQFLVMFLTVFILGVIISLLSSMYFQLKSVKR